MTSLVRMLASLKLAVVLLLMLLVGLASGTMIESAQGTESAGRAVYYAWWFIGLEAALAVNVLASIARFFPWGKQRLGFVVTHAALLVILAGAAVTASFKVEGQLELWEGA